MPAAEFVCWIFVRVLYYETATAWHLSVAEADSMLQWTWETSSVERCSQAVSSRRRESLIGIRCIVYRHIDVAEADRDISLSNKRTRPVICSLVARHALKTHFKPRGGFVLFWHCSNDESERWTHTPVFTDSWQSFAIVHERDFNQSHQRRRRAPVARHGSSCTHTWVVQQVEWPRAIRISSAATRLYAWHRTLELHPTSTVIQNSLTHCTYNMTRWQPYYRARRIPPQNS